MRYRVFMSVAIEARSYPEAYKNAKQLAELLESPVVKMAIQSNGIQLCEEGPVVHRPLPEGSVRA